jgi:hypothetical protein
MLSKKRKDDGQKSKRQRQSRQDDTYLDDTPIMFTPSRPEVQNVPIYQNVVGSTSYSQETYGYPPYYNVHGQWQYHYESYNYQFQQIHQVHHHQVHQHQVHQMPIIRPQPQQLSQQVALSRPIAPPNKTDPQQNMTTAQKIYTHDHNLPNDVRPPVPMNNNALMQPANIHKMTNQQNVSIIQPIVTMQSNLTNIPLNSNMHDHNHINISMQSPTNSIQSKLPDLQSQQAQQCQPQYHNERSKSTNSTPKSVVIKEVSAEVLKKKIDKVSTPKLNEHQPLLNFSEPIVIISDDEIEPELPQNGERKATESKNISVTPTSGSSSKAVEAKNTSVTPTSESSSTVNMKTLDSSKNKGKQVVSNNGQNTITPFKSTNNSPIQNARNSNVSSEKIREFIRLFDEIQMSKEDFGLRLIAITRLYHKLNSLNYDIEGHITLLAENDKLDHNLLREFRNGINNIC